MKFDYTISIGDVLTIIGIIVGVVLTIGQLVIANKQNRAQFIIDLMDRHIQDNDSLQMLYLIEHNKFIYDESKFPLSKEEKMLDKLLYTFDQISMLFEFGVIKRKDLALIEYDFLRVFSSNEVQKYFAYLDLTPHGLATDRSDFRAYRRTAKYLITHFESNFAKRNS